MENLYKSSVSGINPRLYDTSVLKLLEQNNSAPTDSEKRAEFAGITVGKWLELLVNEKKHEDEIHENSVKKSAPQNEQISRKTPNRKKRVEKERIWRNLRRFTVVSGLTLAGISVYQDKIEPKIPGISREISRFYHDLNPTEEEKAEWQAESIRYENSIDEWNNAGKPSVVIAAPPVPEKSTSVIYEKYTDGGGNVVDTKTGEEWILNADESVQKYFPGEK